MLCVPDADMTIELIFCCRSDVNKKRYDTVTFLIAQRPFYALGWVLEQCCSRLRPQLEEVSLHEPLPLQRIPEMADDEMYDRFAQLVEFAYTGACEVRAEHAAALWALACSFGFRALQVRHIGQTGRSS